MFKRRIEAEELRGVVIDPRRSDARFVAYAEAWVAARRRRALAPRTIELYRHLVDRYVIPTFGAAPLSGIRTEQVRAWLGATAASAGSIQAAKAYRLLRAIFEHGGRGRAAGGQSVQAQGRRRRTVT